MSSSMMAMWLFDSLLVTTGLMAAVLLLRRPVAKLFGPGVAYALWLIPAARLLMPSLSGPAVEAGAAPGIRDAVRDSILSGVTTGEPVMAVAASPSIDYAALALTVWLGGAALFFFIQMIRYASMRDDLLAEAEELAVIGNVRVVASDQVAGPLAFGLFRRFIAVPLDFTAQYSPAERELAIAHEMAHHKSGDLFANLAAFTVLCLMWFNPLAWASWSAFRFDQEAACDARICAGKGAETREIYGRALARTAFDGVPTFATALNSPKTIIERLRRLTMKDASKQRRSLGKAGILAAAAIILPLTATIVPAVRARDETTAADAKPEVIKKRVKVIKIHKDGSVDSWGEDSADRKVTKIERDGKTIVVHTEKNLSEKEIDKIIDDAEAARGDAAVTMSKAIEARVVADIARGHADAARTEALAMAAAYIPEIDISEITKNCRKGQPVTTNVHGFDGHGKAKVKIVMCGKGYARVARAEALEGLREARSDISEDAEIPAGVRKDVLEKLEAQIRKLEAENDSAG